MRLFVNTQVRDSAILLPGTVKLSLFFFLTVKYFFSTLSCYKILRQTVPVKYTDACGRERSKMPWEFLSPCSKKAHPTLSALEFVLQMYRVDVSRW